MVNVSASSFLIKGFLQNNTCILRSIDNLGATIMHTLKIRETVKTLQSFPIKKKGFGLGSQAKRCLVYSYIQAAKKRVEQQINKKKVMTTQQTHDVVSTSIQRCSNVVGRPGDIKLSYTSAESFSLSSISVASFRSSVLMVFAFKLFFSPAVDN